MRHTNNSVIDNKGSKKILFFSKYLRSIDIQVYMKVISHVQTQRWTCVWIFTLLNNFSVAHYIYNNKYLFIGFEGCNILYFHFYFNKDGSKKFKLSFTNIQLTLLSNHV